MERLDELLAVNQRQALEFFATGLRDVCEPGTDTEELLYNASVLAHYAQTSTVAVGELATPATLTDVFDNFVLDRTPVYDGQLMEMAAAQCLLLAGFFEHQMRHRHSIRWYSELGAGFFERAAARERSQRKARLLSTLASGFERWRQRHERLSNELRDLRYLLSPPPLLPPM